MNISLRADVYRREIAMTCDIYRFLGLDRTLGPLNTEPARDALERASKFAAARNVAAALRAIEPIAAFDSILKIPPSGACGLFIGDGSVPTLRLIGQAASLGWRIIVEDCEFSKLYLSQLVKSSKGGLLSLRQIPRNSAERIKQKSGVPCLYVIFCDRTMSTFRSSSTIITRIGNFHITDIDGSIAQLPFERVILSNGQTITPAMMPVSPLNISSQSFIVTCSQIEKKADAYLAWRTLATHSKIHHERTMRNGRAIVKSYLRYSAIQYPNIATHMNEIIENIESLKPR